jgi:hypothetical protein
MKILPLGIDYTTGAPLFEAQSEDRFADIVLRALSLGGESSQIAKGVTRGEIQRPQTIDFGNVRKAGWVYLLNSSDPNRDEIIRIIRPLAIQRRMKSPEKPLVFLDQTPEKWFDWILKNLTPFGLDEPPYYLLIVGNPQQIPFRFQSFLSSSFAVGRLDFETLDELAAYVEKILALEKSIQPTVKRQAVFLAPDGGEGDATFFSRRYMAEPLSHLVENMLHLPVARLFGDNATHSRFQDVLLTASPALIYTASHGLGAINQPLEVQKQLNGAIVCQQDGSDQSIQERLFSANDIVMEKSFLNGGVFFQFACFSYGTPSLSDFSHWRNKPGSTQNTSSDFVATFPRRMLAHSKGPIAFIGHVDMAWLYGFADPGEMDMEEWWNPRLKPFAQALEGLLTTQPVGLALQEMNKRYNNLNAYLTNLFDLIHQEESRNTKMLMKKIAYSYVVRNDAQNFMIFGDPAVRLRIPL